MADESVTVICYGQKTVWKNRKDAMDFFAQGVMECDGSERERYALILADLWSGLKVCTDEV